jgi:hypothetical protein
VYHREVQWAPHYHRRKVLDNLRYFDNNKI